MLCLFTMPNIFALITWNSRFWSRILHLLGSGSWNMVVQRKPALGPWPTHLHFLPLAVSRPVKSLLQDVPACPHGTCHDVPARPHCMSILNLAWTAILQIRVGHAGWLSGPGMLYPCKWTLGRGLQGSGYPKWIIKGGGTLWYAPGSRGLHIPCRET